MKIKQILLILCLAMGLSLSACGSTGADDREKEPEDKITEPQEQSGDKVAEPQKQPENEQTDNTESESAGTEYQATAKPAADDEENELEPSIFDEDIFMQFINGEISAKIEADFESDLSYAGVIDDYSSDSITYTFDTTGTTSLNQLISSIIDSMELSASDNAVKTYYAIANTLSGKPILAVKLENLGIYSQGDDSFAVFLFAVNDGQLYMTFAYDCWARSWVEMLDSMIFSGGGSGGAGDGFSWTFYIDETGHYKSLYEMEMLMGEWVAMHGYYTLGMDSAGSWSEGCEVYLLTTPQGNYYEYEADDTVDKEQLNIFTSLLEANGMTHADDVGDVIDAIYKANGIPDNLSYFDGWIQYN